MIPFNRPSVSKNTFDYISKVLTSDKLCGNGEFTKRCQNFFETKYGFKKALLTTSGTDALEMAAILCNLQPDDEVIAPSYTFVSTVLAFIREKAKIVFCDSEDSTPNIDADKIESLITKKTKVIVPVHYAGVACDMDKIMDIANRHNLLVVEDAAQAIDSYYKGKPLGSIGHMGCFSFHETKNITSGEGGLLTINDPRFISRSEIIWEKGTNRSQFFRGEINKYGWVDSGSSFLPSELNAALLASQLDEMNIIQNRRIEIWNRYKHNLENIESADYFHSAVLPDYATNNAHMFYLVCKTPEIRTNLIKYLKEHGINAVFHYLSLHKSDYAKQHEISGQNLPNSDRYTDCLIRLPLYKELSDNQVDYISNVIKDFLKSNK